MTTMIIGTIMLAGTASYKADGMMSADKIAGGHVRYTYTTAGLADDWPLIKLVTWGLVAGEVALANSFGWSVVPPCTDNRR